MDRFMERAMRLARKADPFPNPRVGAVIVKGGKIIGEGYHRKAGLAHAEIEAIRDARRKGGRNAVKGATMYVTLEPCSHTNKRTPPCVPAIIRSGISGVVYAMKDPNPAVHGAAELEKAGLRVTGPAAEEVAARMNGKYVRSVSRPFVAIKMAVSADGKSATRTGDSKWIGGREEREFVARLRSGFDAVMVGAVTVARDDPRLTSRMKGGKDPLRIVVDGRLSIPFDAGILKNPDGRTIVATCRRAPEEKVRRIATESQAHVFMCGEKEVDLKALVQGLAGLGVRRILIEGGSEMNWSAIEAGIVDKLYLFVSPRIIGGKGANGVIGGRGVARVDDAIRLKGPKIKKVGSDLLLEYDFIR